MLKCRKRGITMPVTIESIKIYEVSEIAKKLKAKTKDIENLVIKKKLNGQKIGNKYYVSENSLNIFFNSNSNILSGWENFHNEALNAKKEHESGKDKGKTMKEVFGND